LPVKLSAFSRQMSLYESAWATPERAIAAAIIAARAVKNTMRLILAPPSLKEGEVIGPA
jgi:hypothetical protein